MINKQTDNFSKIIMDPIQVPALIPESSLFFPVLALFSSKWE